MLPFLLLRGCGAHPKTNLSQQQLAVQADLTSTKFVAMLPHVGKMWWRRQHSFIYTITTSMRCLAVASSSYIATVMVCYCGDGGGMVVVVVRGIYVLWQQIAWRTGGGNKTHTHTLMVVEHIFILCINTVATISSSHTSHCNWLRETITK